MTRSRLLALVLCLSLVLAGCAGTGGSADDGADPSTTGSDDGADASSGGDGSGDSGNDGSSESGSGDGDTVTAWERFSFAEGEFYQFRVNDVRNDRDVLLTWDVVAVDGSEVTADVTYDDGTASYTYTLTGENATISTQLIQAAMQENPEDEAAMEAATSAYGYLTLGPFNPISSYFAARDLAVGNSWNLAGSATDGFMTANVEGRDEYAGKECYVSTIRVPDNEAWAESDSNEWVSCIAPDVGLSLYSAYYDAETGELTAEITLETYRSGE
ncbi:hypothetical protein ACFPYI_12555 [Halomarina salina]|uniref:Lipoprotein n=1 Tax=Halomarina salina TaxID=1872699 RepID=A0ABD5RPB2_9EURY|nr:hypothetical protein [Halomarina salina]